MRAEVKDQTVSCVLFLFLFPLLAVLPSAMSSIFPALPLAFQENSLLYFTVEHSG